MKRFFFLISSLILLVSCTAEDYFQEKKSFKRFKKPTPSNQAFLRPVKPSESMQVGLPKTARNNFGADFYEGEKRENFNSTNFSESQESAAEDLSPQTNNEYPLGNFKIGNPYSIFGVEYKPRDYETFEETGTASWYGDDFNGKPTANGEIYNKGDITAAHPTLPLPSIIRATNLRNNKTVVVRVNDRGPFAKNRVIDFSEKSAELLGFKNQGTTEVKIELLRAKTDEIIEKIIANNAQKESR